MICPKCFHENVEGAQFCNHCGSTLKPKDSNNDKLSSILLLIWSIAFIVLNVIQQLMISFVVDWVSPWNKIYLITCIIQNISMILPAIAVKNITIKIICIVLVALPTMYYLYSNITSLFSPTY